MTQKYDYRNFLKERFEERCQRNSRYSLRGFARDLAIPVSRLSEIFNYKSGLSVGRAQQIAQRLSLGENETAWFVNAVQFVDGRGKVSRREAQSKIESLKKNYEKFQEIHLTQFRVISDWHHFAIVDMVATKNFKHDSRWIAKRLGINYVEVELAIERLSALGLLRQKGRGKLEATDALPFTATDIPSEAIKKFHRQILSKAVLAIEFQSVPERDYSALTIPVATSLLPEAKEKIKKFRREFHQWVKENKFEKDEVYCLSTQFFRLTKKVGDT